jgi:hypothetical protein
LIHRFENFKCGEARVAGGGGGCCRRAHLYAALPPTCAPYAVHCETHFPSGFGSTSAFSAAFCCLTHFLTMCCLARCLLVQGPARATCSPTGGHNDGCQHFSQSVTQTPSTLPLASSKDIQVQVSDAAHSPLVRISQGPLSLEQVAIGMFWLRTGMHQLALEFQVDVHQLQHPLASHSSADVISQLNFGGGPGGIGGVGGGGGTQGAGGSFESFCAHMHMLDEQHAVWFIFLSQVVTDWWTRNNQCRQSVCMQQGRSKKDDRKPNLRAILGPRRNLGAPPCGAPRASTPLHSDRSHRQPADATNTRMRPMDPPFAPP